MKMKKNHHIRICIKYRDMKDAHQKEKKGLPF